MLKKFVWVIYASLSLLGAHTALARQQAISPPAITGAHQAQSSVPDIAPIGKFPIIFGNTEIVEISSSPVGSLTPENRAQLILQNIQSFADSKLDIEKIQIVPLEEGLGIGMKNRILMVVTDQDAENAGKNKNELANQIIEQVKIAVSNDRQQHNWKTYGMAAAFSVLSLLGLWQALFWNKRAYIWLKHKAVSHKKEWKAGVHLKGVEVLSGKKIDNLVLLLIKFIRMLVVLLCLYFFLPLILSFFPETSELGSKLFDYLITPFVSIFHTVINYIPNLFYIFVIGVIAFYVLEVISFFFGLLARGELKFEWFYQDWALPTYQIIRFLVIITALISAYPYIPGSSSNAFQGVGLVLGAIISFASSSAISNIVAGIILTYTRAFRLDDRIKVGDTTGDVVEKTLLVTRIKTIKQVIVTIPNSLVMGSQIINYSTSADEGEGVILHTSVTIGYDVPWQKVHSLLIAASLATEKIQSSPHPFVLQTSLDDFYVSYEINAYTKEPEKMAVIYSNLHQNILEKFNTDGVEIMSPHYYAVRDGNASTVPSILTA